MITTGGKGVSERKDLTSQKSAMMAMIVSSVLVFRIYCLFVHADRSNARYLQK